MMVSVCGVDGGGGGCDGAAGCCTGVDVFADEHAEIAISSASHLDIARTLLHDTYVGCSIHACYAARTSVRRFRCERDF
jgi:hypothetical protein